MSHLELALNKSPPSQNTVNNRRPARGAAAFLSRSDIANTASMNWFAGLAIGNHVKVASDLGRILIRLPQL
jgi:hypothetical protein